MIYWGHIHEDAIYSPGDLRVRRCVRGGGVADVAHRGMA